MMFIKQNRQIITTISAF